MADIGAWALVLSPEARIVYSRLTEFPIIESKFEAFAALCKLSRHKTRSAIAELERHGFLSVQREV